MVTREQIEHFPDAPGVYLMRSDDGTVLYVGKAKNLRRRVRSYFGAALDSRYQIKFLMARVAQLEFIVTATEKEALILENTLIKQHRPRYNMNLRDDKTYFSLRMDMTEEFPRISIIRKVSRDGARYFGPYASAAAAREVLKQLYRLFPLRHYPLETCRRRGRPCLFYQLKQCSAPCHGRISRDDYAALAEGAALFLEGKKQDLVRVFQRRMAEAARAERYEEAARFRDLIRSIEVTLERQHVVSGTGDCDVLGLHRDGGHLTFALLFVRGGSIIGSRTYRVPWTLDDGEGVASFLNEYYGREVQVPPELLLPVRIADSGPLGELLSERRGGRVTVSVPLRGTRVELVRLAVRNAEEAAREQRREVDSTDAVLEDLQRRLHLPRLPRRIECYDISTIQGRHSVGSGVSFLDGRPDKDRYRRYRIRTVGQADDFAMMREVLSRRFAPDGDNVAPPDLIVVDGGIGQLNVLTAVLEELHLEGVAAVSLAKSRVIRSAARPEVRRSDERVFLPGRKNPVALRQNSAPLLLLARIRDEAHRFAITYHRQLRGREFNRSRLRELPGVGVERERALLRHFGSMKRIAHAAPDEIAEVKGVSRKLAEVVWRHFHGGDGEPRPGAGE
jgi:excinuclease ABC subunit C